MLLLILPFATIHELYLLSVGLLLLFCHSFVSAAWWVGGCGVFHFGMNTRQRKGWENAFHAIYIAVVWVVLNPLSWGGWHLRSTKKVGDNVKRSFAVAGVQ